METMKSYQHLLFEWMQDYPRRVFKKFIKGKVREQFWQDVVSVQRDSFYFGMKEVTLPIGLFHQGMHVFKLHLPQQFDFPKKEVLQDFEQYLIERGEDVFIYRWEYLLDEEKEGTMIDCIKPLGIYTTKLYKWLKELEEEDFSFTYDFKLDIIGHRNTYFTFDIQENGLNVYFQDILVETLSTEEDFQSFKESMKTVMVCKKKVKELLHNTLNQYSTGHSYRVSLTRSYFQLFKTFIQKNEHGEWEFIFSIRDESHHFHSLDHVIQTFPYGNVEKIAKGLQIKALFNE